MSEEPVTDDLEQYEDVAEEPEGVEVQPEQEIPTVDARPEWAQTRTVTVYGRDFLIGPPNVGITLRIINVFGNLGIRGERAAMRVLSTLARGAKEAPSVSGRAALFGMLAALSVEDVIALGSAVLQFDDDMKGRGWLRQAPAGQQIPLSPLIRALFLNIMQSDDLKAGLADFFDGLRMTEGLLDDLGLDLE